MAGLPIGLTESSGTVCNAGRPLAASSSPFGLLSLLLRAWSIECTHSATSGSSVPGAPRSSLLTAEVTSLLLLSVVVSAASSSTSVIVSGFDSELSHGCLRSMAYVGRILGILRTQLATKSWAASE